MHEDQIRPEGARPARILIIDWDKQVIHRLTSLFDREGYQTTTTADGLAGLAAVLDATEDERPDLVITELNLSEKNGYEVIAEIQHNEATAELPIIILTVRAQDVDVKRGWQAGCVCYLTKPFNELEVLAFTKRAFLERDMECVGGYLWKK